MPTYQQIYEAKRAVKSLHTIGKPTQDAFTAEVQAAYKAAYPHRKWDMTKAQKAMPEVYTGIYDRYKLLADKISKGYSNIMTAAEDALYDLAKTVDLTPQTEMAHITTKLSYSYSTQGFGACMYAEGSAKNYACVLSQNGFTTEVREVNEHFEGEYHIRHADYQVWANCTPMQADACFHLPGMTLKQWLKWCRDNGMNPFVLNPYLPHDLEW